MGNGGSIAVNQGFNYRSLLENAENNNYINEDLKDIFGRFKTDDFKLVMRRLLHADIVNQALSVDGKSRVNDAYKNCRDTLIKTIQKSHPGFKDIDEVMLGNIANFLKQFKTVVSLNYDLLLYWVMYKGNQQVPNKNGSSRCGNRFKDCFLQSFKSPVEEAEEIGKLFNPDWNQLREPHCTRRGATLIFYLHGNLSLATYIKQSMEDTEVKITSGNNSHLDEIYKQWNTGEYVPLFVCEGNKEHKLAAVRNSTYLSAIYNEALAEMGDSLVIYGWNMNEEDDYILERLAEIFKQKKSSNNHAAVPKIAISVFTEDGEQAAEDFMSSCSSKIKAKLSEDVDVEFFDSASSGCWHNDNVES